jgi:hypothetical protein
MFCEIRERASPEKLTLVAEYNSYNSERPKVCVKTHFVVEAINNRFPFVLITERPYTPNADFESYIKFTTTPEPNPFLSELNLCEEKRADWENLFSHIACLPRRRATRSLWRRTLMMSTARCSSCPSTSNMHSVSRIHAAGKAISTGVCSSGNPCWS